MMGDLYAISDLQCNCDCTVQTVDFVLANYESQVVSFDAASQHNSRECFVLAHDRVILIFRNRPVDTKLFVLFGMVQVDGLVSGSVCGSIWKKGNSVFIHILCSFALKFPLAVTTIIAIT